jgi:hypothetical protein
MKRILISLVVVVVFTAPLLSQMGFGIKGGVNLATIGGPDVPSYVKSRTGFSAGAYLEIRLPMLFTLQPELLYSTKGFTTNPYDVPVRQLASVTQTEVYSYLEIPVLVKYSLPVPVLHPSLYVGPQVGFLLSATSTIGAAGVASFETDIKSLLPGTDLGGVVGATVHMLVADVDVRYTFGMKTTTSGFPSSTYNRVWSIMVEIPLY